MFLDSSIAKKTCPIGYGVFNQAVLDRYGYTYCERCILKWLNSKRECPMNKQSLTQSDLFVNRSVRDDIEEADIVCMYAKRGCNWQGKLRDLNSHLSSECSTIRVHCHFCDRGFMRKDVKIHQINCLERIVKCQFCSSQLRKSEITVHSANLK